MGVITVQKINVITTLVNGEIIITLWWVLLNCAKDKCHYYDTSNIIQQVSTSFHITLLPINYSRLKDTAVAALEMYFLGLLVKLTQLHGTVG